MSVLAVMVSLAAPDNGEIQHVEAMLSDFLARWMLEYPRCNLPVGVERVITASEVMDWHTARGSMARPR